MNLLMSVEFSCFSCHQSKMRTAQSSVSVFLYIMSIEIRLLEIDMLTILAAHRTKNSRKSKQKQFEAFCKKKTKSFHFW